MKEYLSYLHIDSYICSPSKQKYSWINSASCISDSFALYSTSRYQYLLQGFPQVNSFMHNIALQQTTNICLLVTVYLLCVGFAMHFHCDIFYQIAESHSTSKKAWIAVTVWSSCCCNGLICGIFGKISRHISHSCVLVEISNFFKKYASRNYL